MIRRRPKSNQSPPTTESPSYEKRNKEDRGVPFLKISLGATTIIFIVFLFVIVEYFDSVYLTDTHYDPNNANISVATPDDNNQIPFIRYEPINAEFVKQRMDYAISHGDADNPNNPNNTIGQHLLDFGIIGFPKCGTTTMMKWLNMHHEIAVHDHELLALQKNHPARIVRIITKVLPEGRYRRGYKSPNDVEDGRARNKLRIHYPETKLLVGIRHPVLWFESFYNYRVQNGFTMPGYSKIVDMKKTSNVCGGDWHGACAYRANFHKVLARWGKTPLLSLDKNSYESYYVDNYNIDDEWKIFPSKDQKDMKNEVNKTEISPNPIFLYDVGQLHMPTTDKSGGGDDEAKRNQKHYEDFVLSLQEFMGVPRNLTAMPAMIRESPGRTEGINATEQASRNGLKIDMCDDELEAPRKLLLEIGANVAEWITKYFAKSPHGVSLGGGTRSEDGTSRLLQLLESYGKDPCPERRLQKQKEALK